MCLIRYILNRKQPRDEDGRDVVPYHDAAIQY